MSRSLWFIGFCYLCMGTLATASPPKPREGGVAEMKQHVTRSVTKQGMCHCVFVSFHPMNWGQQLLATRSSTWWRLFPFVVDMELFFFWSPGVIAAREASQPLRKIHKPLRTASIEKTKKIPKPSLHPHLIASELAKSQDPPTLMASSTLGLSASEPTLPIEGQGHEQITSKTPLWLLDHAIMKELMMIEIKPQVSLEQMPYWHDPNKWISALDEDDLDFYMESDWLSNRTPGRLRQVNNRISVSFITISALDIGL